MMRVLFMQSQSFLGADSNLQAQMLRDLDRTQVQLSVALTHDYGPNPATSARRHIEAIEDICILPTNFGRSRAEMATIRQRLAGIGGASVGLASLAHSIRTQRIQIIHGTEKPRDAFYGVLLAKLSGVRSVVHMHVSYGDWLSPLVKWALHRADAIVTVSDFSAQSIIDAGYPTERVHVVLNALDLTGARWSKPAPAGHIRQELGIPPDAVVLGIVSRLFLYKGHRDLIEALAQVHDRMPNYRLVIVGEDDPRSHPGGGSFTAELQHLAAAHGLSEQIIFTGFRSDIPQLMAGFDIYAMPSWEEPFGMVYLEAMALQKPVIAWDLAGPAAIIVDGETGILVPPKSTAKLGEAIRQLAADPDMRRRFGQAGRQRVEQAFSSPRMCNDMLNLYRQLLRPQAALRHQAT